MPEPTPSEQFKYASAQPSSDWADEFFDDELAIQEKHPFAKAYGERVTKLISICVNAASSIAIKHPEASGLLLDAATNVGTFIIQRASQEDLKRYRPEGIEIEVNPDYKPILRILREGVRQFEELHPDITVSYSRDKNYVDIEKITEIFNSKPDHKFISELKEDIALNQEHRPIGLKEITADKSLGEISLIGLATQSKSVWRNVEQQIARQLPTDLVQVIESASAGNSSVKIPGINEPASIQRDFLRELWTQLNGRDTPVSTSEILCLCLEKTKGNLSTALYLATSFLRSSSRNNIELPGHETTLFDDDRSKWFINHIKDEFSPTLPFTRLSLENYTRADKPEVVESVSRQRDELNYDFNRENQIGKPYHAFHIAALLNCLVPEFIATMTAAEYFRYGAEHGLAKLWADMKVLKQIRAVDKWLNSFSKK